MNYLYGGLFLLFLIQVNCLEKYLQFEPNPHILKATTEAEQKKKLHESLYLDISVNINAVVVYGSSTEQVLIRIMKTYRIPIIYFKFRVKELMSDARISVTQFCYKKNSMDNFQNCQKIETTTKDVTLNNGAVQFTVDFNEKTGATFISKFKNKPDQNRSGLYYLIMTNSYGTVTTNYYEIQDIVYFKDKALPRKELNFNPVAHPVISYANMPNFFPCGNKNVQIPLDYQPLIKDMVQWRACDIADDEDMNVGTCLAKTIDNPVLLKSFMPDIYIYPNNGTLVLTRLTRVNRKFGLICALKGAESDVVQSHFGSVTGGSGVTSLKFDFATQPIPGSFIPLTPVYTVYKLKRGKADVSLDPVFSGDTRGITGVWLFDGSSDLPSGHNSGHTTYPFSFSFPSFITEANSGKYTLTVSQNGIQKYIFTFDVRVRGPPQLTSSPAPPEYMYKIVGDNATITCGFSGGSTSKELYINGWKIGLGQAKLNLDSIHPSYLRNLDATLSPNPPAPGQPMTYAVRNLKNHDGLRPESHLVSCMGVNENGAMRTSTLIRVIKKPELIVVPNKFNCTTGCMNHEEHEFNCEIDTAPYESEGVIVNIFWQLNNMALNNKEYEQSSYFDTSNGTTLTLKPVFDDKMQRVLKDAKLVCRVRLYDPRVSMNSVDLDKIISTQYLIYDSINDPPMNAKLSATVRMEVDGTVLPKPKKASFSWIAAVVIAILIIIIIVSLTAYMLLRNKGETYMVDAKERAQGNDPEKEIQDNEIFHAYERPEEDPTSEEAPVRGSRFSLNDSVGVGSESEGELEEYDLDPGKFNEEGSFIGQYASDARKKPSLPSAGARPNDTQV